MPQRLNAQDFRSCASSISAGGETQISSNRRQNYQLGAVYDHNAQWSTDVTLFHSKVDDLIERPDRRSSYQNLSEVEFEGVELATSVWLHDKYSGRLAYTYLDAAESSPDGGVRQLRSRAKHSVYGELQIDMAYDLQLSLNATYSDGLYDLDGDENHVKLASYFLLHVKLMKQFSNNLGAYLSFSNLMDEDYVHRLGYPRPGREARLGVTLKL